MTSMPMTLMMSMSIGMSYKNNTQYWIDSMLLSILIWFYYEYLHFVIKLTINKTIDCLFHCHLCEVKNISTILSQK